MMLNSQRRGSIDDICMKVYFITFSFYVPILHFNKGHACTPSDPINKGRIPTLVHHLWLARRRRDKKGQDWSRLLGLFAILDPTRLYRDPKLSCSTRIPIELLCWYHSPIFQVVMGNPVEVLTRSAIERKSPRTDITESSTKLPSIHEKLSSECSGAVWKYEAIVSYLREPSVPVVDIQTRGKSSFHLTAEPHHSWSRARSISWPTHLPRTCGFTWKMPPLPFAIQSSGVIDSTGLVWKVCVSS